jgi:hypothetical protein
MAMAIFRGKRAFALGVVGGATLLATMAGEYLMHNPAEAQDLHTCMFTGLCRFNNVVGYFPLPATAVVLPNGTTLDITLYQMSVLALGALIFASALACAMRTTLSRWVVLAVAAVLLTLTLVVFHAQEPTLLFAVHLPSCNGDGVCIDQPHKVVPYAPYTPRGPYGEYAPGAPGAPPLINPIWFMVPAAALGLLTAGIAFLPAERRRAMP